MNPPFSVTPNVDGASLLAGLRHLSSALARLSPKGRLVALLSDRFDPCSPRFAEAFARLCETARLVFHVTIDGALYQRHGTTTATRILVFDKEPADTAGYSGLIRPCYRTCDPVPACRSRRAAAACSSGSRIAATAECSARCKARRETGSFLPGFFGSRRSRLRRAGCLSAQKRHRG